ncbi:hypothetical protein [Sediminibacterium sp.]|uniref:hypothetical protein n=1 Tax=Sediminibacterium sp. TaxID=1917865 RepID=UPI003F69CF49
MLNRFLKFLLLIVFTMSCDDNSEKEEQEVIEILPSKVGNFWNYRVITQNFSGDTSNIEIRKMEMTESLSVNGLMAFKVKNIIPIIFDFSFFSTPDNYLMNGIGGLYRGYKNDDDEHSDPIDPNQKPEPEQLPKFTRYLKFPTYVGDKEFIEGAIIVTESVNSSIHVPYGDVTCIKYLYISESDTLGFIWFKPNVGIIKLKENASGSWFISELINCNIAQ